MVVKRCLIIILVERQIVINQIVSIIAVIKDDIYVAAVWRKRPI